LKDQYYSSKLSANRLKECYDVAPLRVVEYLEAEIKYVLSHINETDAVLELGCGYGRVLERFTPLAPTIVGIDTSKESLELAKTSLNANPKCHLFQMDAATLGFRDSTFDKTICIQNGISAFKIEPIELVLEAARVTRSGGKCIFSSYSDHFWNHRLDWFIIQSEKGLLGEIDWEQTKDGVIVCKDGFKSITYREEDFRTLTASIGLKAEIVEIDGSSLFCIINVQK